MLLNYRRKEKKTLIRDLLASQIRSMMYGVLLGSLLVSSICFLRKLFGRIHYYNLLMIPGFISGLALLVETRENQILDTLIFFNSFIETLLQKSGINKTRETLMFVGISGLLMHLMANRRDKIGFMYFWFYTPPVINENSETGCTCSHKETCQDYFFEGLLKYFSIGYAISIVKSLLPRMGKLVQKPSENLGIFFSKSNVFLGLFIGSYVGLYRVVTCFLTRTSIIERKFHGLVAGMFSGLMYAISPNIQILVIAITTLLQMIYSHISQHFKITNHFWQRQLLFMLCHGYLLHQKFCFPNTCSPYYRKMIDACTNNKTQVIYKEFICKYFS